jgi:DNA polymerase III subunit delta'
MPSMSWDVFGHDWAVHLLRRDLTTDRLAHAYLFVGADGIGKRTLALELARATNCLQPPIPGDACGQCRPCVLFGRQKHPDLSILQPEGSAGNIAVDAARALSQSLTLKPLEARFRVALLLDFHRANASAANALLKTIEEPPPSSLLLITAESADSLLPTVVSRCRVLSLRPALEADVLRALTERHTLGEGRSQSLARLSGGRIGWALSRAEDPQADETQQVLFAQWRALFRQSLAERFTIAQDLASDRDQVFSVLRTWTAFTHDLLLLTIFPDEKVSYLDFLPMYQELAEQLPPARVQSFLHSLRRAEAGLEQNANARLSLEAALLDVPRISAVQ